jgi:hypothetical protein
MISRIRPAMRETPVAAEKKAVLSASLRPWLGSPPSGGLAPGGSPPPGRPGLRLTLWAPEGAAGRSGAATGPL